MSLRSDAHPLVWRERVVSLLNELDESLDRKLIEIDDRVKERVRGGLKDGGALFLVDGYDPAVLKLPQGVPLATEDLVGGGGRSRRIHESD